MKRPFNILERACCIRRSVEPDRVYEMYELPTCNLSNKLFFVTTQLQVSITKYILHSDQNQMDCYSFLYLISIVNVFPRSSCQI